MNTHAADVQRMSEQYLLLQSTTSAVSTRMGDSLTFIVAVGRAFDEAAGAEVDKTQSVCVEIDDEVFVLEVSMYDSRLVDCDDCVDDVAEPPTTDRRLVQRPVRCDVVE